VRRGARGEETGQHAGKGTNSGYKRVYLYEIKHVNWGQCFVEEKDRTHSSKRTGSYSQNKLVCYLHARGAKKPLTCNVFFKF